MPESLIRALKLAAGVNYMSKSLLDKMPRGPGSPICILINTLAHIYVYPHANGEVSRPSCMHINASCCRVPFFYCRNFMPFSDFV